MTITYGKLKKGCGLTFRTKGYAFKKGIWIPVKPKDVQYLMDSGRIEFAPDGTVPKNDVEEKSSDGVITIEGSGKEAQVTTKKDKEEIDDDLKEAEDAEIKRIREKYKRESEKRKKAKAEEKKRKKEEEKNKKEQEKKDKTKDVTNKKYIQDKTKEKGDEL